MKSRLPIDELNAFEERLRIYMSVSGGHKRVARREDIIDEMLDLFLLFYADGAISASADLGINTTEVIDDSTGKVIYKEIDGKTWVDRITEYYDGDGSPEDAVKVADTEAVRIFNESGFNAAVSHGANYKTWHTMEDWRVRDTHAPLDLVKKGISEEYHTFDGDSALAPGGFDNPNNNCNCRCFLTFSK